MAKSIYKIPTTLDVTYFDMEFNLKSKNGVGFNKPVTAKVLVSVLIAIFLWFYLVFQTFISSGGIPIIIGFSITWAILAGILVKSDNSKRLGFELIFSAVSYLPKSGRELPVRLSDKVQPFKHLTGVDYVDVEDGLIHFMDGKVGHVYHVVGSASNLMFEADKQMILNEVDKFYRKMPYDAEIIYDTVYESHSVEEQVESVKEDIVNMKSKSKGLNALLQERKDVLELAISGSNGLISLHQYAIIVADDMRALREFENLIIGDVENEGIVFRLARTLGYNDVVKYYSGIFN